MDSNENRKQIVCSCIHIQFSNTELGFSLQYSNKTSYLTAIQFMFERHKICMTMKTLF
jgi:hypothetical protein